MGENRSNPLALNQSASPQGYGRAMILAQPDLHLPDAAPRSGASATDAIATDALAGRWAMLHDQAAALARLAGLSPETGRDWADDFPALLTGANAWQRELVQRGLEDIDALMQPGLTALRTIAARRRDATSPALALWREFHAARAAILAVLVPGEPDGLEPERPFA